MFGSRIEDRFVNDAAAPARGEGTRSGWPLLLIIALGMGGFLAWAWFYQIDEVTRGTGRVVPSRQLQVVQSLEGGIVASIDVREGDVVEKGSELMRIDDTRAGSDLGELKERQTALLAAKARIEAEARGADSIAFPDGLPERSRPFSSPAAVSCNPKSRFWKISLRSARPA